MLGAVEEPSSGNPGRPAASGGINNGVYACRQCMGGRCAMRCGSDANARLRVAREMVYVVRGSGNQVVARYG